MSNEIEKIIQKIQIGGMGEGSIILNILPKQVPNFKIWGKFLE